ncbi:MAG: MMPL family transporter [Pseudohongiellaceae bacterium]
MPNSNRFVASYTELLLSWPKTVLGLFLLLTIALGLQAPNFKIDASPDTLLTRDNQLYTLTQQVSERFAPQEFLLVTYQPRNDPLFSEATFSRLRELSTQLLTLERVASVRSILNVPLFGTNLGLLTANTDLNALTIDAGNYDLAALPTEFTDHPIYKDLLVNADLSATSLQVLFRSNPELQEINVRINALNANYQQNGLTETETLELQALEAQAAPLLQALEESRIAEIEAIRGFIAQVESDAIIHLGGLHVLAYQLIQIITSDLLIFGTAIGIGICLMLIVLFRSLRWICIPALCCICSVLSTMGLFALLGIKATVISSNFIALQLILTLAIVIHLIVDYRETAASAGKQSQRDLIKTTLMNKVGPCFFAGITTSVGFGSLIFSGIQPVIAFGWMMIIAMTFSIIVSLILFPVLLELLPTHTEHRESKFAGKLTASTARLSLDHPRMVVVMTLVLIGVSITGLFRLTVENSFINYFRADTEVHQELAYIDREFGGSTPLDLVYTAQQPSNNPDIVISANTVQTLQLIQHNLTQHPAVGRILSPVNLTDLARQLNGGPLTEYELTAAYWLMDEEFRDDLLGAFFDPDTGQARINIWIRDLTPDLNRAQLLTDIRSEMQTSGIDASSYTLSNMFVLYQDILQRLFSSQILTLGLVYVVMLLTFFVIFRSFRLALIALIPNVIPTVAILGIMGWLSIPLDLMTITIAAIAMGIAVDDTIHYIHRFQEEHDKVAYVQAIEQTHASVGIACLYTSLMIVAGFSMLAFSDFVPSILFGLLTSLAMILALVTGLCLLPILLRWMPETPQGGAATVPV